MRKCLRCDGRGGGYETCYGLYPEITYEYVEIGDCEPCKGTGQVEDIPDDWDEEIEELDVNEFEAKEAWEHENFGLPF